MRNIALKLAAVLAVMLAAVVAVPAAAQASALYTVGGGCRLSANWWVNASFNWTGSTLTYGVLTSPGPLQVTGTLRSSLAAESGSQSNGYAYYYRVGSGTNPYTYRADLNRSGTTHAIANVRSNTGVECKANAYP